MYENVPVFACKLFYWCSNGGGLVAPLLGKLNDIMIVHGIRAIFWLSYCLYTTKTSFKPPSVPVYFSEKFFVLLQHSECVNYYIEILEECHYGMFLLKPTVVILQWFKHCHCNVLEIEYVLLLQSSFKIVAFIYAILGRRFNFPIDYSGLGVLDTFAILSIAHVFHETMAFISITQH